MRGSPKLRSGAIASSAALPSSVVAHTIPQTFVPQSSSGNGGAGGVGRTPNQPLMLRGSAGSVSRYHRSTLPVSLIGDSTGPARTLLAFRALNRNLATG